MVFMDGVLIQPIAVLTSTQMMLMMIPARCFTSSRVQGDLPAALFVRRLTCLRTKASEVRPRFLPHQSQRVYNPLTFKRS